MKALSVFALAALVGLSVPAGSSAQPMLRPVDQATQQPDFFSFRARLLVTLARRDVEGLMAVVHKDIKNSFGGDDGIAGFRRIWFEDRHGPSIWEVLTSVLALGGVFREDGQFTGNRPAATVLKTAEISLPVAP